MKKALTIDMLINISLGSVLTVKPLETYNLFFLSNSTQETFVTTNLLRMLGIVLFFFGLLQIYLIRNPEKLTRRVRVSLAILAFVPAALLLVFLMAYRQLISLTGTALMFTGVVYMVILGLIYLKKNPSADQSINQSN